MPQYETGEKGITDYTTDNLIPIFNNCFTKDDDIISSLFILLTIDKQGNVISVDFPSLQVVLRCKDKLMQELLEMPGWKPGKMGEQAVCTKVALPIRCLKWE